MNTHKRRAKFKNFQIILESGYSYTVVTVRLIVKLNPKKDSVMQCHNQAVDITTNMKVKIDLTLPELSATKTLM